MKTLNASKTRGQQSNQINFLLPNRSAHVVLRDQTFGDSPWQTILKEGQGCHGPRSTESTLTKTTSAAYYFEHFLEHFPTKHFHL